MLNNQFLLSFLFNGNKISIHSILNECTSCLISGSVQLLPKPIELIRSMKEKSIFLTIKTCGQNKCKRKNEKNTNKKENKNTTQKKSVHMKDMFWQQ